MRLNRVGPPFCIPITIWGWCWRGRKKSPRVQWGSFKISWIFAQETIFLEVEFIYGIEQKNYLLFENSRSIAAIIAACRCTANQPFTEGSSKIPPNLATFLLLYPVDIPYNLILAPVSAILKAWTENNTPILWDLESSGVVEGGKKRRRSM